MVTNSERRKAPGTFARNVLNLIMFESAIDHRVQNKHRPCLIKAIQMRNPSTSRSGIGYAGRIEAILDASSTACRKVNIPMPIELTAQQQSSLDADGQGHHRVVDPRTRTTYVLVTEVEYERVQELLEDERRQKVIRATGLRNAVGRMDDES